MEKIWLRSYPADIPAEINLGQYRSIVDLFQQTVSRFAGHTAYVSLGKRLNYEALDRLSRDFAAFLQGTLALPWGSRVALMMPNVLQYPVALFGALRAGCTVVNCNPLYTARELEHQLRDSGAEVVVILENFAHTLQQVLQRLAIPHVIVTSLGEMLGFPKGWAVDLAVRRIKKMVPPWSLPGARRFHDALALGARQPLRPVEVEHGDIAFLQYTGGTTGVAKGAMLTHGNIVANLLQAHAWIGPYVKDGEETIKIGRAHV